MALTDTQYQSMRLRFRGLLSDPYRFVSERALDSFLSQLKLDAGGGAAITAQQKSAAEALLVTVLTAPAYAPAATDIGAFLAQATAAAPAIITALVATDYQRMKSQFTGALSVAGIRTEAQMIGYVAGYSTTPLTIFQTTGVAFWVRADLGVSGTTNVTALADQSGNGRNMAPITTPGPLITAVDATLSGRQTLAFDNTLNLISISFALAVPFYYLAILKPVAWNSAVALVRDTTIGSVGQIAYAGGSPNVFQNNGSFVNSVASSVGSWQRFRASFTNSTADYLKIGSAAQTSGANAGAGAPANLGFNYAGGGDLGRWVMYEFLALPGTPTPGELAAYDTYAANLSASIQI